MKSGKKTFHAVTFLILSVALLGCMAGKRLNTSAASPAAVTGTYTLLLYGCHYPEDVTNVAILVSDASKYPVEIYDLDTSYKVMKGVPAQQALSAADSFLRCTSYRLWKTELRQIPDDSGGNIGYEVRPLYLPYEFGEPDVLWITYSLQGDRVRAYIKLDPDVKRAIEAPGPGDSSHDHN
jgi:hypothetical protein